jgi:phenylacetate-CoA ligase
LGRWKDRLYQRLYRRTLLNTFELSEERVPQYLARLNRYRPEVIVAYGLSLYAFARALAERGLKPYSPRSIIVGAEKIHPFQRALIEQVFGAPVFETYGSREVMLMGAECAKHEGMHLTMENLLIEILDDDGRPTPAGREGNVVVTDLYNYGMPFIRYANGDRAVAGWGTCSCGRGLPTLKEVVGRRTDMVHTPDGRHISGVFFPHLLKDFPAIRRFLVVQDRPDHLELRMVVAPAWSETDRCQLERCVRQMIGPQMGLDLRTVGEIPLTPGGKQPVVLNVCGEARTHGH